jgi:hypothetical protein
MPAIALSQNGTIIAFSSSKANPRRCRWAVYNVHSTISDGLGSLAEIAGQAREARVALIVLTAHGNPNRAASVFRLTGKGWPLLADRK